MLWEIIRCPVAIRIHGSLTPACFVASHVRKYHYALYLSWPHPKAIRISQHGSVRSASLHLLSLLVKEEVSWRTCGFGWGSCPDTGNVPDEWVFSFQSSLRSFSASHVVDHGKGKNIRLQEKNFENFHNDLLSGIRRNKKRPDFHLGNRVGCKRIQNPGYKRTQISSEFSINRFKSRQTFLENRVYVQSVFFRIEQGLFFTAYRVPIWQSFSIIL